MVWLSLESAIRRIEQDDYATDKEDGMLLTDEGEEDELDLDSMGLWDAPVRESIIQQEGEDAWSWSWGDDDENDEAGDTSFAGQGISIRSHNDGAFNSNATGSSSSEPQDTTSQAEDGFRSRSASDLDTDAMMPDTTVTVVVLDAAQRQAAAPPRRRSRRHPPLRVLNVRERRRANELDEDDAVVAEGIGPDGAKELGEALRQRRFQCAPRLRRLSLYSNCLGNDGATHIAAALKPHMSVNHASALVDLNLRANEVGTEGAAALADALRINSTLKRLDLGWNRIGNAGAAALGRALRFNKSLETLYLFWNDIGSLGMSCLASSLAKNTTLVELQLQGNRISNVGCAALANALAPGAPAQGTDKDDEDDDDEAVEQSPGEVSEYSPKSSILTQRRHRLEALRAVRQTFSSPRQITASSSSGCALQKLFLDDNGIGDEGVSELAWALRHCKNRGLQILSLRDNEVTSGGTRHLLDWLRQTADALQDSRKQLRVLDLEGNAEIDVKLLQTVELYCKFGHARLPVVRVPLPSSAERRRLSSWAGRRTAQKTRVTQTTTTTTTTTVTKTTTTTTTRERRLLPPRPVASTPPSATSSARKSTPQTPPPPVPSIDIRRKTARQPSPLTPPPPPEGTRLFHDDSDEESVPQEQKREEQEPVWSSFELLQLSSPPTPPDSSPPSPMPKHLLQQEAQEEAAAAEAAARLEVAHNVDDPEEDPHLQQQWPTMRQGTDEEDQRRRLLRDGRNVEGNADDTGRSRTTTQTTTTTTTTRVVKRREEGKPAPALKSSSLSVKSSGSKSRRRGRHSPKQHASSGTSERPPLPEVMLLPSFVRRRGLFSKGGTAAERVALKLSQQQLQQQQQQQQAAGEEQREGETKTTTTPRRSLSQRWASARRGTGGNGSASMRWR